MNPRMSDAVRGTANVCPTNMVAMPEPDAVVGEARDHAFRMREDAKRVLDCTKTSDRHRKKHN